MVFSYDLSDSLRETLAKLAKRDSKRAQIVYKKMKQIVNSDEIAIEHFKNLSHDMKDLKRVHIDSSFVLTFRFDKKTKHVKFVDFDHHDNIYER